MNQKPKPKTKRLPKPRISVYKLKPEQVHKSAKEYARQKVKKDLKELLKNTPT